MAQVTGEQNSISVEKQRLSFIQGPVDKPLVSLTLGELLDFQCRKYDERECLVIPWTQTRWTYRQLRDESLYLARALISRGVARGDRIALMAGNCEQYVSVFFACMRVGAILVILNNTYTASEAKYALDFSGTID